MSLELRNYQQCVQIKEEWWWWGRSMRTDEQQCLSMKTVLTVGQT